jgi:hypothetical protein
MSDTRALAQRLRDLGQDDPAEFLGAVGRLLAVYPRADRTPEQVEAYSVAWASVPRPALRSAFGQWIRTNKWPPAPSEILALVAERQFAAMGVAESAEMAWQEVLAKLGSKGTRRVPGADTAYGPAVTFRCRVTSGIMTAAWWRQLGACSSEQITQESHAFYRAWRAAADKLTRDIQCGRALPPAPEVLRLPAPREQQREVTAWRPEVEQIRDAGPVAAGEAAEVVLAFVTGGRI